jgi:hypothetical protein
MKIVEALVRWTELKVQQPDSEESYARRVIDGDEHADAPQLHAYYDYSPMTFNLENVDTFNRSHDPSHTTLRMKSGEGYVIKFPYREFTEVYATTLGVSILSLLPDDYKDDKVQPDDDAIGGDNEAGDEFGMG